MKILKGDSEKWESERDAEKVINFQFNSLIMLMGISAMCFKSFNSQYYDHY